MFNGLLKSSEAEINIVDVCQKTSRQALNLKFSCFSLNLLTFRLFPYNYCELELSVDNQNITFKDI